MDYLTTAEVAERFQVSVRTIERWRETGTGPVYIRISNRFYRYRAADCDQWAAARTQSELKTA